MTWIPTIKLYAANGSTLIYTFQYVTDLPDLMKDSPDYVELKNKRGAGSITIAGGNKAYPFRVTGIIRAADYAALVSAMSSMNSTIVNNTNYVLKIDLSISTTVDLNVKRLRGIDWQGPERKTTFQRYTVEFLALAWN